MRPFYLSLSTYAHRFSSPPTQRVIILLHIKWLSIGRSTKSYADKLQTHGDLLLLVLSQRERVMGGRHLRLSPSKLNKLLFQLLPCLLQLPLLLRVVLLQLVELGLQLLLVLLQLGLLLLHALHEHLPHLVLLLLQLGQMVRPLRLERLLEGHRLVVTVHIGESHLFQSLLPVQFVVAGVRLLAHVLHVRADQHLAEFHKVTVRLVLHLDSAPGVLTRPDGLIPDANHVRAANHCEWNVRIHGGVHFGDGLVIGWELIDLHSIGSQFLVDLRLELLQFGLGDSVRLSDDRNDVHLRVQLLHADQVDGLETVTGGADEVQTDMDATVVERAQRTLDLQLLLQERLELTVNGVDHRLEGVVLVDLVAVAHGVADGQLEGMRVIR